MKKTNFQSTINYKYQSHTGELNSEPSLTIPDKALTIPEMLKRFSSGRPVNVKVYEEYSGDDDSQTGVDIRTLDIVEIQDLVNKSAANLGKLRAEEDRRRKHKQDADLEASIIAKYEARRAERKEAMADVSKSVFIQPPLPGLSPENGA